MELKVSSENLNKLRCSSCMGYLLCAPICVLPDGTNICGRCTSTQVSYRNTSLETLLNDAQFPCKHENKGCRARLKFITDFDHETSCTYGPPTQELMATDNEDVVPAIKSSDSTCNQDTTQSTCADETIFMTPKAGITTIRKTSITTDEPSTSGINSEMHTSLPPSRPQSSRSFDADNGRTSAFSNRRNHNLNWRHLQNRNPWQNPWQPYHPDAHHVNMYKRRNNLIIVKGGTFYVNCA
ncbi:hypothetical protein FQA39_LY18459 [Lamprigera yunnana]|nr:hypothetical protein FQA39_LY18459 [Lamprigera yunnana]